MRVALTGRDLVVLLGLAATTAFAVSLGVDPWFATELAVVAALLLLVAVLLREVPVPDPPPATDGEQDALTRARRAVEGALSGPWGVQGRFRRVVRDAVRARLGLAEQDLDDVLETLPPELATLLTGQWEHDRGLTPAELERVLTAVEELDP